VLSDLLSKTYGRAEDYIFEPSGFMGKAENFAYSISKGERIHARGWKRGGVSIELGVSSNHEDTTYNLKYTDDALWEEVESNRSNNDEKAL
jgi:hypothetical protein